MKNVKPEKRMGYFYSKSDSTGTEPKLSSYRKCFFFVCFFCIFCKEFPKVCRMSMTKVSNPCTEGFSPSHTQLQQDQGERLFLNPSLPCLSLPQSKLLTLSSS